MAKPDLGTKRLCPTTGKKFYDLNKGPVISPYTGEVVPIAPVVPRGPPGRGHGRRCRLPPSPRPTPEAAEAELVSLEEADAEEHRQGQGRVPERKTT